MRSWTLKNVKNREKEEEKSEKTVLGSLFRKTLLCALFKRYFRVPL